MSEPEDKFKHLKFRLPDIKSLAMLKMEKNFIAYIEKGYPRQPYADKNQPRHFLIQRIQDEVNELKEAYVKSLDNPSATEQDLKAMMEECADISNLVDYLFEKLVQAEIKLEALRSE